MKICTFGGCDRPHRAKGYCQRHYMQHLQGKELTPIRNYRRVEDGHKECSKCGVTKPVEDYYNRIDGLPRSECKVCMGQRAADKWADMARVYAEYKAERTNKKNVTSGSNQ